ncbi:hypothetical protein DLAC_08525 [Tieghemostelium lacteum]|uniref:Uncharacterized protein n=1 Tax=Tieghemostelium lacteum TaxID=361077 RepID=A0A151Z839_TIELA|nr:hypothetical protein DLAC_08525 [Tieghemostelium lacteum]|eukprot:KYQ89954.1 hypothetical protein DLAC_08525 [Tieghemostelium lacteum]
MFYHIFKNKYIWNIIANFIKTDYNTIQFKKYNEIRQCNWMGENGYYGLLRYKIKRNEELQNIECVFVNYLMYLDIETIRILDSKYPDYLSDLLFTTKNIVDPLRKNNSIETLYFLVDLFKFMINERQYILTVPQNILDEILSLIIPSDDNLHLIDYLLSLQFKPNSNLPLCITSNWKMFKYIYDRYPSDYDFNKIRNTMHMVPIQWHHLIDKDLITKYPPIRDLALSLDDLVRESISNLEVFRLLVQTIAINNNCTENQVLSNIKFVQLAQLVKTKLYCFDYVLEFGYPFHQIPNLQELCSLMFRFTSRTMVEKLITKDQLKDLTFFSSQLLSNRADFSLMRLIYENCQNQQSSFYTDFNIAIKMGYSRYDIEYLYSKIELDEKYSMRWLENFIRNQNFSDISIVRLLTSLILKDNPKKNLYFLFECKSWDIIKKLIHQGTHELSDFFRDGVDMPFNQQHFETAIELGDFEIYKFVRDRTLEITRSISSFEMCHNIDIIQDILNRKDTATCDHFYSISSIISACLQQRNVTFLKQIQLHSGTRFLQTTNGWEINDQVYWNVDIIRFLIDNQLIFRVAAPSLKKAARAMDFAFFKILYEEYGKLKHEQTMDFLLYNNISFDVYNLTSNNWPGDNYRATSGGFIKFLFDPNGIAKEIDDIKKPFFLKLLFLSFGMCNRHTLYLFRSYHDFISNNFTEILNLFINSKSNSFNTLQILLSEFKNEFIKLNDPILERLKKNLQSKHQSLLNYFNKSMEN